jgi:hypothetical protein
VRAAWLVIAVSVFSRGVGVELVRVPEVGIRVIRNAVGVAFSPAGRAGVGLRVVGARGWGGVEADGWLGRVSDERLAELYRGARCLVYPSLYEGFGIPVLEAMACGTPVVTSAGGATEEVAGGAAVLVDPHDPGAVAEGIEEAVRRRDELVARGLEQARAFAWERVAAETRQVYEEAAA